MEVSSRNVRLPKDEDAKPRKIRYVFVALEFRHSNLEMLLRVMQKLVSYGRLSGSVFFVSWSKCTTFASHYTYSGEREIQPQESHQILARSVWLNAHEKSKGKNKTNEKPRQATVENIFVQILAWETCDFISVLQ